MISYKQFSRLLGLFNQLTKEQQENFIKFMELKESIKGLPVEQQQEIIDNITDNGLLEMIETYKSVLS